jgi:hypothetical protein
MKKILFQNVMLTITCLLISSSLHSQSPQGIPYQAVMRNPDGSVMANSAVSLTFMIHDGTANGTVEYQESHALTSNAQGLVSCVVGNGVVSEGNSEASLSNINWGGGAKFLHVMMGSTDLGTQQMFSVPYALYGENVEVRVSAVGDTLVIGNKSVIVPGVSAANPPTVTIGQDFQGGKVAYIFQPGDAGYVEGETHGLIAAAQDLSTTYPWGCYLTDISGSFGLDIGTGAQNTVDIVNAVCGGAAQACADLVLNGYSDWFLPSINELIKLYDNRTAIGGFQNVWYWSSSGPNSAYAWKFYFANGNSGITIKYENNHVRALRTF